MTAHEMSLLLFESAVSMSTMTIAWNKGMIFFVPDGKSGSWMWFSYTKAYCSLKNDPHK